MTIKDLARFVRDDLIPRERLRRANPAATITSRVMMIGDPTRVRLAEGVHVSGPTVLAVSDGGGLHDARLAIGHGTYVGEFNNIRCAGAPISIGSHCLISQHISIVGSNHGTAAGEHIVEQPWTGTGVIIGNDVWVGAGSVILPGARVGDGAVIAANSVVRGHVPESAVMAGAPARQIGSR